jgi:hypothetical protein
MASSIVLPPFADASTSTRSIFVRCRPADQCRAGPTDGRTGPIGRGIIRLVPETLDFDRFDALTFDCYGTLIDWETGLLEALRPILGAHGASLPDDELLEAFARHESEIEAGPFRRYREVLGDALRRSRIRRPRWRACIRASRWASSRTATTTCSRPRHAGSASSSTGS